MRLTILSMLLLGAIFGPSFYGVWVTLHSPYAGMFLFAILMAYAGSQTTHHHQGGGAS